MPPTFVQEGVVINTRYRVEGFLGAGGFAAVYLAEDTDLHRPVAIKVLSSLAATPDPERYKDVMDRFKREARAMARIRHPNVVTIHDFGFFAEMGLPFIVMELLEGHDLDEELKLHGPIHAARALPLIIDCLEALHIGHDQGIVHKDLKPSNLFVCHRGSRRETLRLLDFGIARLHEQNGRLTGTGQIMGTPQYLSPEYIREQEVTPALDVYQMGLLLVEALSAQKVVGFDNALKCAIAHREGDLPIPEALLRSALGPVIRRALALSPQERYSDAGQFAQALASIDPTSIPTLSDDQITLSLKDLPEDFDAPERSNAGARLVRLTGQLSHEEIVKAISQRPTIRADRVTGPASSLAEDSSSQSHSTRRPALARSGAQRSVASSPAPDILSFDEDEATVAVTPAKGRLTAHTPTSPLDEFAQSGGRTPALPADAVTMATVGRSSSHSTPSKAAAKRTLVPADHEKTTISGRHARIHRPKSKQPPAPTGQASKKNSAGRARPIAYKSVEAPRSREASPPTDAQRPRTPTPTAPIAAPARGELTSVSPQKPVKAAPAQKRQSDLNTPPAEEPAAQPPAWGDVGENQAGRRFWLIMALAAIITTVILGAASVVALRWYLN